MTFGSIFEAEGGRTSGFDYLRLSLAIGVIFWHGSVVSYGHEFDNALQQTSVGTLGKLLLPMFFALSGFLVAGSLFKTPSLLVYASHRVFRIFPALIVEVLLSAFILGTILTTYSLYDYFTNGSFIRYLGNAFGIVYVLLPGVFTDNPTHWVNISIWTVPYELECYIALLVLAALGIIRRKSWFVIAFILTQIAVPMLDFILNQDAIENVNRIHARTLVTCFLAGVGFYIFRNKVHSNIVIAIICFILSFLMAHYTMFSYLIPIPIAYITVYFGIRQIPKLPIIFRGDYSYGLYLYAFPFQQLQAHLFPDNRNWLDNMLFALPCAALFAAFSWHLIEKPILMNRKALVAWVERKSARVRLWSHRS